MKVTENNISKIKTESNLFVSINREINRVTGRAFFEVLIKSLAEFYNTKYVFIGKHDAKQKNIETLSVWQEKSLINNFSYSLEGTPSSAVIDQQICYYPDDVEKVFSNDKLLKKFGVHSYLGTPIVIEGQSIGLLVIMDDKPLLIDESHQQIISFFAERVGAEFNRLKEEDRKNDLSIINRSLLETLEETLYFYNTNTNHVKWFGNVKKITGYSVEKIAQNGLEDYIAKIQKVDRKKHHDALEKAKHNGLVEFDYRFKMASGKVSWIREKLSKIINKKGEVILIGLLSDVSTNKSSEEVGLMSIIKAVENERGRVARDLHDGLAQLIVSSKLFLSNAFESDQYHDNLAQVYDLLDEAALECSSISSNLMPKSLKRAGLIQTIYELLRKFDSKFFKVSFQQNISEERFSSEIETNLFRIVQESVNNIVKYAKAKTVEVHLYKRDKSLWLKISDDGDGFDPKNVKTESGHGNGHLNIQSRVEALRGDFELSSAIGEGTSIVVNIPIGVN